MSWKYGHIPFVEDLYSNKWYSISNIAKLFKIPKLGQKKLFIFLKNNNILLRNNQVANKEYLGKYFRDTKHPKAYNYTPQANPEGVIFIWNLLKEQNVSDGKAIKEIKREPTIPNNVFF